MGLKIGTCATCAFLHDVHNECRANPPIPLNIAGTSPPRQNSVWPKVDANDWCGQYVDGRIKGQRKTYARQINDGDVCPVPIKVQIESEGNTFEEFVKRVAKGVSDHE